MLYLSSATPPSRDIYHILQDNQINKENDNLGKFFILSYQKIYCLVIWVSNWNSVLRNCTQLSGIARNCAEYHVTVRNCEEITGPVVARK